MSKTKFPDTRTVLSRASSLFAVAHELQIVASNSDSSEDQVMYVLTGLLQILGRAKKMVDVLNDASQVDGAPEYLLDSYITMECACNTASASVVYASETRLSHRFIDGQMEVHVGYATVTLVRPPEGGAEATAKLHALLPSGNAAVVVDLPIDPKKLQ